MDHENGDVSLTKNVKVTSHPTFGRVVMKCVSLQPSSPEYYISLITLNEGEVLERLSHPSIVSMIAYSRIGDVLTLYLPYMKGGDLFEWMIKHPFPKEDTIQIIVRQLSSALSYLHSLGWAHRDVKLENILVGDDILDLKLCDFGYARRTDNLIDAYGGSYEYAAPEVLWYIPHDGSKADCWSFGVMVYLLSQNTYPYGNTSKEHIKQSIDKLPSPKFFRGISEELKEVVCGLLDKNPTTRMSMDEIHRSPFLKIQHALF